MFLVRYKTKSGAHGYALKFHTNPTGRVFEMVGDAEATLFATPLAAYQRALAHNLPHCAFQCDAVQPIAEEILT